LQLTESGVGFVVDSLVPGFVSGHQRQAARLIGQRTDCHGDVNGAAESCEFLFDFVAVARISAQLLAEECAKGDETYRREYLCEFGEMEGAVFSRESIEAALQDFEPLNL
jgi:hypothetical protein